MFSFNCNRINIGCINTTESLRGKEDDYLSESDKLFVVNAAQNYKFNLTLALQQSKFNANLYFVGFSKLDIKNHEQDAAGYFVPNRVCCPNHFYR